MHSSATPRSNGGTHDGLALLTANIPTLNGYSSSSRQHARRTMQALAFSLACFGMLSTAHAQDTNKEDITDTITATTTGLERTSASPAIGTISATLHVTGSSSVRGIWGKSGTLSIDTIAKGAVFNVTSTGNNTYGIDTSSGVNIEIGTIAGDFNITSTKTNIAGFRSYGKIISIDTITADSLMAVEGNFSAYGIYSYQGRLDIGDLAGQIDVKTIAGNYARGLCSYGNTMDYLGRATRMSISARSRAAFPPKHRLDSEPKASSPNTGRST